VKGKWGVNFLYEGAKEGRKSTLLHASERTESKIGRGGGAVNSLIGWKARVGSQPYLIIQCIVRRGIQPSISLPVERSEGKGDSTSYII
jgi:hypothetical protein